MSNTLCQGSGIVAAVTRQSLDQSAHLVSELESVLSCLRNDNQIDNTKTLVCVLQYDDDRGVSLAAHHDVRKWTIEHPYRTLVYTAFIERGTRHPCAGDSDIKYFLSVVFSTKFPGSGSAHRVAGLSLWRAYILLCVFDVCIAITGNLVLFRQYLGAEIHFL